MVCQSWAWTSYASCGGWQPFGKLSDVPLAPLSRWGCLEEFFCLPSVLKLAMVWTMYWPSECWLHSRSDSSIPSSQMHSDIEFDVCYQHLPFLPLWASTHRWILKCRWCQDGKVASWFLESPSWSSRDNVSSLPQYLFGLSRSREEFCRISSNPNYICWW